ncbi:Ig domain-containing protein (plasmid) [Rahnella aquatilis HX2]|nr:Ig domain-containing protein [Rahnella aquatilis HX2]
MKITNKGKPQLAESMTVITSVTGVTAASTAVALDVGESTTVAITVLPADASDPSLLATSTAQDIATVTIVTGVLTITGVAAGTADVIVMTNDGLKAVVITVTIS